MLRPFGKSNRIFEYDRKKQRRLKSMLYICSILAFFIIIFISSIVIYRHILRSFYASAGKAFRNPNTNSEFAEQGITYDNDSGLFLFSGYMKDHTASPIYLVEPKSGETVKQVFLLRMDGSIFTGHSGGIAVSDSYVYIAGSADDCIYVYDKSSILQAENNSSVVCQGIFPLSTAKNDGIRASFLASSDDGILYVGEFHVGWVPQLRCRENHKFYLKTGKTNALLVGFRMDEELPLGLEQMPCLAYCIPDRIQGAAICDEKLILSQSFGAAPSSIIYYTLSTQQQIAVLPLLGVEVSVYGLPEAEKTVRAFPLTEGIAVENRKVYIASELMNMIPKKLWKIFDCDWCFSLDVLQ